MKKKENKIKVGFFACGKNVVFSLSESELRQLRHSSIRDGHEDWERKHMGRLYNFAVYATFDMECFSKTNKNKLVKNFPLGEFDLMEWSINRD